MSPVIQGHRQLTDEEMSEGSRSSGKERFLWRGFVWQTDRRRDDAALRSNKWQDGLLKKRLKRLDLRIMNDGAVETNDDENAPLHVTGRELL